MDTILTRSAAEAAQILKRGGLVAFPTETVYGLGADIFDEKAVSKIFSAKRRPADNPLIAHIFDRSQLPLLAKEISRDAGRLVEAFFPGPLTIVCRKTERVPMNATAGLETIGIRMPSHDLAREFLKNCETPVAAPSANLSGRPSPTTWRAVAEDLQGRIDCILQGDATEIGLESTVVDCTSTVPTILRLGSVTFEQIREVIPEIEVVSEVLKDPAKSPGLKHKHYAPSAAVKLVSANENFGGENAAFIGITEPAGTFVLKRICDTTQDYSREIFEFFRECDRQKIKTIYCETVENTGIGAALMDRLTRAAKR